MQAGLSDNVGASYGTARTMIETTAAAQAWTDDQTAAALADLDAAYDAVTGWEGLAIAADSWLGSTTAGEAQVVAFWADLADRAGSWTAPNADKLRAAFASAGQTATTTAAETIGSPVEAVDQLVIEPLAQTATQVTTVATDRRAWIAAAAVAVLVLVVIVRR